MVVYLCVLIVFSLHRELFKLIIVNEPLPEMVLSHISSMSPAWVTKIEASYVDDAHCTDIIHKFVIDPLTVPQYSLHSYILRY
jgi:hypothetical protein